MNDTTMQLVQALTAIADDLDHRGYPFAGAIRQAARLIATTPTADPDGCRGCGAPLDYAGNGRPRKWCSEACRKSAGKSMV